jgi:hypothetical protein
VLRAGASLAGEVKVVSTCARPGNRVVISWKSALLSSRSVRRAEAAHGKHEKRIGRRDEAWPDWYAEYMAREQTGTEPPT